MVARPVVVVALASVFVSLVVPVVSAEPAAAATTATLQTSGIVLSSNTYGDSVSTVSITQGTTSGAAWIAAGSIRITAPAGETFTTGAVWTRTFSNQTEARAQVLTNPACLFGTTTVSVLDSVLDPATSQVSAAAIDYDVRCRDTLAGPWSRHLSGQVRWGSATSYESARPDPTYVAPSTPVGSTRDLVIPLVGTGTADLSVTSVTLDPQSGPDVTLLSTTCAGVALGSGTCSATVRVAPAALVSTRAVLVISTPDRLAPVDILVQVPVRAALTAPTLRSFPTAAGPALAFPLWTGAFETGDRFTFLRRTGSGAWETVRPAATVQPTDAGEGVVRWVDTSAVSGIAYEYAAVVSTFDGLATSAPSTPTAVTWTTPTVPGARSRVATRTTSETTDFGGDADTASGFGVHTQRGLIEWTHDDLAQQIRIRFPTFAGPGTYTLPDGALDIARGSSGCAVADVRAVVRAVAYDASEVPTLVDASFVGRCLSGVDGEQRLEVRLGSNTPMAVPRRSVGEVSAATNTSTDSGTRSWRVTNAGPDALTATAPVSPPQWTANGCDTVLAAGESCLVTLTFHGAATPGSASAALSLGVRSGGTPLPDLTALLTGVTGPVPAAPGSARADRVGRLTQIQWTPGAPVAGHAVTSYVVERAPLGTEDWSVVAEVLASTTGLADPRSVDGVFRYRVAGVNDVGQGTPSTAVDAQVWQDAGIGTGTVDEQSGVWGLHLVFGDGTTIPFEIDGHDHQTPALSPDGRWVVYAESQDAGFGAYNLWTRSLTGDGIVAGLTGIGGDSIDPAVSPDGTKVAFTHWAGGPALPEVRVTGFPISDQVGVVVATGASHPSWISGATLVVEDDRGADTLLATVSSAGGALAAIAGTVGGSEPSVSRDGRRIAFSDADGLPAFVDVATKAVAPYPGAAGYAGADLFGDPSFDSSGRSTWTRLRPPSLDNVAALSVADDGSSVVVRPVAEYDGFPWDTTAPTIVLAPLAVSGPAVGQPFTVVDQSGRGSVTTRCRVDSAAWVPCVGAVSLAGVAAGTHAVSVEATDPQGNSAVASRTLLVDTVAPSPPALAVAPTTLATTATFTWSATDVHGPITYDVRYRFWTTTAAVPGAYAYPSTLTRRTTTRAALAVPVAGSTCVSVRARDAAGNTTAWSADKCASRPLDSAVLAGAGWTTLRATAYYGGSAKRVAASGRSLATAAKIRVSGVAVLATTCPTCGVVDVYVGTTRVGRLSLVSRTTVVRATLTLPRFTGRTGQIVLRTTSARPVTIDAVVPLR